MLRKFIPLFLLIVSALSGQSSQSQPVTTQTHVVLPDTTPPDPKVVLGVGVSGEGNGTGHVSGWANACYLTGVNAYVCGAEDFISGTTSTRVGLEKIVWRKQPLYLSVKGDAGVATGLLGTAGGSYGSGVSVLYDFSSKKQNFLVVSVSYLKSNTVTPITLHNLSSQLVLRFGLLLGH